MVYCGKRCIAVYEREAAYEKETIPSGKCTAGRQLGSVPAPDEKGGRKAEAAADESRRKKQEIKTGL